MSARGIWVATIGSGFAVNVYRWHKADDTTLCSSTLRPFIEALPAGSLVTGGLLFVLHHHLVAPIKKKRRSTVE